MEGDPDDTFEMYQVYALLGFASAVLLTIFQYTDPGAISKAIASMLEDAAFILSMLATVMGGRSVRTQFQALGSDKSMARANPAYMRDRRVLQISLFPAFTALAVVLAAKCGYNLLWTWIIVPVVGVPSLIVINRVTGWSVKP